MTPVDAVVIGGGIAGVSAAYYLANTHRVVLVEGEVQLAYHSTGRSAALYFENYGAAAIRPLTKASRRFFHDPPAGLADSPLVSPRGALWVARPDQEETLVRIETEGRETGCRLIPISPAEAVEMVPVLVGSRLSRALHEPDPLDIDVAAVHQAFLRGFRLAGGDVVTGAAVTSLEHRTGRWILEAGTHRIEASTVVNAAGAWGDRVASMAGVAPVGLNPMRRTAFMVAGDAMWADWPMVIDADHDFYLKADGTQLLCSPADETPTDPGDARPDPLDVALAIDRINESTTLGIRSVRSEWAGLRTFTADRAMVIGPEPGHPGFVWLVGQGGTGIQTAPAAAELVASLVRGEALPSHLADYGVDPERLAVDRLR